MRVSSVNSVGVKYHKRSHSVPYLEVSDDALQVVVPLEGAQVDLVPALLQRASLAGDVVLGAASLLLRPLRGSKGVLGGGAGTLTSRWLWR